MNSGVSADAYTALFKPSAHFTAIVPGDGAHPRCASSVLSTKVFPWNNKNKDFIAWVVRVQNAEFCRN